MDRAPLNIRDGNAAAVPCLVLLEFDVREVRPAFGQNLQTDGDAPHMQFVVCDLFTEEINGSSTTGTSGCEVILQFFRRLGRSTGLER